jgi:WD40 repeat protein
VCFDPSEEFIIVADHSSVIRWNFKDRDEPTSFPNSSSGPRRINDSYRAISLSPDGALLAAARDFGVQIWDIPTLTVVANLEGHKNSVRAIVFVDDGRRIVTGSWDHTIRIWDIGLLKTTQNGTEDCLILEPTMKIEGHTVCPFQIFKQLHFQAELS